MLRGIMLLIQRQCYDVGYSVALLNRPCIETVVVTTLMLFNDIPLP